jgi:hypothetical protein
MLEHLCNTGRSAMRILPFMLAVFVFSAGIGTSAEAQNYPWCEYLGGGMGGGGGRNCGFISFEQCMDSARGNGNDCRQNTQYVPPPGEHGGSTVAPGVHPRHKSRKNS